MHASPPCESRFGSPGTRDEAARWRSRRPARRPTRRSPDPPRAAQIGSMRGRPRARPPRRSRWRCSPKQSHRGCRHRRQAVVGDKEEVVASVAIPSLLHEGLLALIETARSSRPSSCARCSRQRAALQARIAGLRSQSCPPSSTRISWCSGRRQARVRHRARAQLQPRRGASPGPCTPSARARFECPVVVVVIAVDDATARWARPIALGGSSTFVPFVIGRGRPVVTDPELAAAEPELALLSVMAHGRTRVRRRRGRSSRRQRPRLDRERGRYISAGRRSATRHRRSDAPEASNCSASRSGDRSSRGQQRPGARPALGQAHAILRVLTRHGVANRRAARAYLLHGCRNARRWLDRAVTRQRRRLFRIDSAPPSPHRASGRGPEAAALAEPSPRRTSTCRLTARDAWWSGARSGAET